MRYIGTAIQGKQIEIELMDSGKCVLFKDTSESGSRYYTRTFEVYFDETASKSIKLILKAKKFLPALGGLVNLTMLPSTKLTLVYDMRSNPSVRVDVKASDAPQLFASYPKVGNIMQSMNFCPTNHNGVHGVVKA